MLYVRGMCVEEEATGGQRRGRAGAPSLPLPSLPPSLLHAYPLLLGPKPLGCTPA